MTAVVLALLAAASWGTGDFLGGIASRRAHVLTVLALSQVAGLAGVAIWIAASREPWPGAQDVLPAVGAGAAGAVGLACLYRGLAIGAMGVVAPISALSPTIPLALDVLRGDAPSPLQWAGIVVALSGVAILSREPASGTRRRAAGVGLALVAAIGFGLFVVGLDASADGSVPWAVGIARTASTSVAFGLVLAARRPLTPAAAYLPLVLAIGVFDTTANALIALATTETLAGVVAVVSSLYPVATVALAHVVLRERLAWSQRAGAVVALTGVATLAVGSS